MQSNVDNKRSREELQAIAEKSLEISGLQSVANFAPGFHDLSPIAAWLHAGATPEDDIYPLVQAKAKASIRSWAYFTPSIMEALARRSYLNDQNLNGQNLDTQSLTAQNLKEADDEGSFITTNTHTTPNPARGPAAARAGRPGSAHALMLAGALAEAERSEGGG